MSYTEEVEATAEDYFDTHYQLLKSKLKTIYFFHFKTAEQPKFDPQDTEYCDDYGQPYPYTIVYKTISNKISQEGLDNLMYEVASIAELDPKFNQMLFYTEIDNKEDLEYFLSNIIQINNTYPDMTIEVKNNKTFNNLNIPTEVITMN